MDWPIERICFLTNYNSYNAKRYFTQGLSEACERLGIATMIIDVAERGLDQTLLRELLAFHPTLTASFHSILPMRHGPFLWDHLELPHWAIWVDATLYATELINSPYCILSCVDRDDEKLLKAQGCEKSFFMAHGVARREEPISYENRPYDVLMAATCYDYEGFRQFWREALPLQEQQLLEEAVDQLFTPGTTVTMMEALANAWQAAPLAHSPIDVQRLFFLLDYYCRGRDRVALARAFEKSHLHLFGSLSEDHVANQRGWDYYLGDSSQVTLHPPVGYEEMGALLRKSKICLNSVISFRNGCHERVIEGMLYGAIPLSSSSFWLEEQFVAGEELLLYRQGEEKVQAQRAEALIADAEAWQQMAQRGQDKVLAYHTWDAKLPGVVKELSRCLKIIYEGQGS